MVDFIVAETRLIHFSDIDCVHVTASFKGSAIKIAQDLIFTKGTRTHICVYLSPFLGLFTIVVKRKIRVLEKISPSFLQNFLVLMVILSFLDEVVKILIVVVDAQKTHLLKIVFFYEIVQLGEK